MRPVVAGIDRERVSLVCPFESNPNKWIDSVCTNAANPTDKTSYHLITDYSLCGPTDVCVAVTYGEMLENYIHHPESKSLGPDGQRCTGRTVGLLKRDHVIAGEITRISKECPRGLEEGDEPTEVMEFESVEYKEKIKKTPRKDMVQPTIGHVHQLRKIGYPALIRAGCSRRFLDKICHRAFMRAVALRDFERAVRECKLNRNEKWYANHNVPVGSIRG
jgi:hypothetical protein